PFGGPHPVLGYLARSTHRVAITNRQAFDTRLVCPSSGSGVGAPAEVDRCPLSTPDAADPTAGPAVLRRSPDSAHPHLHCPGFPSLSPRPSPGSSACTPCRLMNGPSWHPSG